MIRAIIVNFYRVLSVRVQKEIKMDIFKKAIKQRRKDIAFEKYNLTEEDLQSPTDCSTLKGFKIEVIKLHIKYGEGSPALALAVGQLFDNHCRR